MTRSRAYLARKNEEKQKVAEKKIAARLVSERFPSVSKVVLLMDYNPDSSRMMRTVNIFPSDFAYFHMHCLRKDCLDGGFNLTPAVQAMIKKKKRTDKGRMVCKGEGCSVSKDPVVIFFEIKIQYSRKSKK